MTGDASTTTRGKDIFAVAGGVGAGGATDSASLSHVTDYDLAPALTARLEGSLRGKAEVVRLSLACLLSRGHLLIEDVPGVGKTTLANALARAVHCGFHRLQFTADMLPADVTGVSVFNSHTAEFEFKPGPVFTNFLLADEINRATPKTQSALLEAMNEGQVSVDGRTYPLDRPFMVLATQNPLEHHGTYPLPESQLDRFLMRLRIGYPDAANEREILRRGPGDPMLHAPALLTAEEVIALQESIGLHAITDGELRRTSFHADFIQKIEGAGATGRLAVKDAGGSGLDGKLTDSKPFAPRAFEDVKYFEGCLPIEVMARCARLPDPMVP